MVASVSTGRVRNLSSGSTRAPSSKRFCSVMVLPLGGTTAAGDRDETTQEKAYFPMIAAGAQKLLKLCSEKEAPVAGAGRRRQDGKWVERGVRTGKTW